MTLNMRNFESYEKTPYCRAHVPKPQSSGVASDSMEQQRIKNVSSITSNLQYRAEFTKTKLEHGASSFAYANAPTSTPSREASVPSTAK